MPEDVSTSGTTQPLVVACDESGNDGGNLLAGSSPVFVHASVSVSKAKAAEIMAEVLVVGGADFDVGWLRESAWRSGDGVQGILDCEGDSGINLNRGSALNVQRVFATECARRHGWFGVGNGVSADLTEFGEITGCFPR